MRSRHLAWVLLCLSTVYGCGGTSPGNPDGSDVPKDTPVDKTPDAGPDADTKIDVVIDAKDAPDVADVPKDAVDGGGDVDVGGPPPCKTASECPGQDSECSHRTCVAGACGTANEALGKVLATQIIGDCKVRQCAANGTPTTVIDDRDIPDDINPCTRDTCTGGVSAHAAVAKDTACGGGKLCNATGQCIGCTIAEQCPGTDNACRTRTCIQQICGVTFVAAGTKLTDPTSGDCKGLQCDGQGVIQTVAIAADVPADNNACTQDQCNGTTPTHQPVARNTSCGTGLVCDGATHCVACLTASTCPGVDNECQNRTCTNGACGISYAAAGKAVAAQTSGDCKRQQCNGSGAVVTVTDDSDPLVDNNPCSRDVCTAGVPSNPPLPARTNCGPNLQCDGKGLCVGCLAVSDCPGTDTVCKFRTCTDGRCGIGLAAPGTPAAEQTAGDCKQNQCDGKGAVVVVSDNDPQNDNNPCTDDVCTGGVNSHPFKPIKTTCGPAPLECDATGHCVNCVSNAECGTDTECITNTCEAGTCKKTFATGKVGAVQTPNDCKRNQCDSAGNLVPVPDNTDLPVDLFECTLNVCTMGEPSNPPVAMGTMCSQAGGTKCNGTGSCVACLSAADCTASTDCRKYACTLGMCVFTDEPAEKPLPAEKQMDGDCQELVCTGTGTTKSIAKNDDPPALDNNECTDDLCIAGVPSHPVVSNRTCETTKVCKSDGTCVQCNNDIQCGSMGNTECLTHACVANVCVHTPHPGPMAAQTAKDCKINVCNAAGVAELGQPDDTDKPIDGNACTADVCSGGVPSNPAEPPDTSCGVNGKCDGAGLCNNCNSDAECGVTDECVTHACVAGGNGVKSCVTTNAMMGKVLTAQIPGDCKKSVCNANGVAAPIVDQTDIPQDNNLCTLDLCSAAGVPSHADEIQGHDCTPDGAPPSDPRLFCNSVGICVGCNTPADCGADSPDGCIVRTCSSEGMCGRTNTTGFDALVTQPPKDCKRKVCAMDGTVIDQNDGSDKPNDGNSCTDDLCNNGTPSNPPLPSGTICAENGGRRCDGAASCVPAVAVLRVGKGSGTLSSAATAAFVEVRSGIDGSIFGTEIPLPTTDNEGGNGNKAFVLSGTASSEGALSLSQNGKFVTVAGYSAAPATPSVVASNALRLAARIDAFGTVNSSFALPQAMPVSGSPFFANNVRTVVTDDGTNFWFGGPSGQGGIWYFSAGSSVATQIMLSPSGVRVVQIVGDQIYGSSSTSMFSNVFTVGTGKPTLAGQMATPLPGLPATNGTPQPYAFSLLELDPNDSVTPDTLYLTDDRTPAGTAAAGMACAGGGIQKWIRVNATSNWSCVGTIQTGHTIPNPNGTFAFSGTRGLAAVMTTAGVKLVATTATNAPNAIILCSDQRMTVPGATGDCTTVTPSETGSIYRGVAFAPLP